MGQPGPGWGTSGTIQSGKEGLLLECTGEACLLLGEEEES